MRFIFSFIVLVLLLSSGVVAQNPPAPVKEYNPNAWQEFTSAEGKFSVLFPGRPAHRDSTMESGIGKVTTHRFELDTDLAYYYVSYADIPSVGALTPEQNKEMLDGTRDRAISGDNRLISEREISIGGVPGRELLVSNGDLALKSRFVVIEGRLYQLIFGTRSIVAFRNGKPSADAKDRTDLFEKSSVKFLDSFKVTQ